MSLPITEKVSADNVVDGFFNNAEALTVTGLLADQYRDVAENIAAQAITFHLTELSRVTLLMRAKRIVLLCSFEILVVTHFADRLRKTNWSGIGRFGTLLPQRMGLSKGLMTLTALLQSPHFITGWNLCL